MPELPEIETICLGIRANILSQKIISVIAGNHKLRKPIPKNLVKILTNQCIQKTIRRGKYILLETQDGTLIIHLGMSGSLQLKPSKFPLQKHEHMRIILKNNLALCYKDPRRFGLIAWTTRNVLQHPLLKNLGPEPLGQAFTADYLFKYSKKHFSAIKQFIMNNKIVVGIGNIYANEILFAAKINPLQKSNTITLKKYQLLVRETKVILRQAIRSGGTTIKDYINGEGKIGGFQNKLKIYGKQNQLCVDCKKTTLKYLKINGRATIYCPTCQK